MRHLHVGYVVLSVAVEVGDSRRVQPRIGRARRWRLGDDRQRSASKGDDRKSGAPTQVGANEHDFIDPIAIEVGKAGLPILEHRILWQGKSQKFAVAQTHHQARRFVRGAQHEVLILRGRVRQPCLGNRTSAASDTQIRYGAGIVRGTSVRCVRDGERGRLGMGRLSA